MLKFCGLPKAGRAPSSAVALLAMERYHFGMDSTIYAISYKMRQEVRRRVASVVRVFLVCAAIVTLFMTFVMYPVVSRSNSMSPDISEGDVELVVPFLRTPSRGDVVLVQTQRDELHPAKKVLNGICLFATARRWCPFDDGRRPMVRRVIGMPGDTIYIDKYVVYIKPRGQGHFLTEFEVVDRKYDVQIFTAPTNWDINLGARSGTRQIELGEGEYYLLGDNRMECADSRLWGPVGTSAIQGRVVLQYFPLGKFRLF